jgi:hypothetical protein
MLPTNQGKFTNLFVIDPRHAERSSQSSRMALTAALLLAGGFGLVTAFSIKPATAAKNTAAVDIKPVASPKGAEIHSELSANDFTAKRLITFCSENVTASRSFVIFKNGTCVVVTEPCTDPLEEAKKRLNACNEPEARFVSEVTREGNLMISFKEPIFHNFTPEQMTELRSKLLINVPTLLTPKEKSQAKDGWMPPEQAQFGLLARRRMLDDAANPVPIRIVRAKQRALAGG